MEHSVKEIAKRYSELSDLRKDKKRFNESKKLRKIETQNQN
jgi:hypothetical protein